MSPTTLVILLVRLFFSHTLAHTHSAVSDRDRGKPQWVRQTTSAVNPFAVGMHGDIICDLKHADELCTHTHTHIYAWVYYYCTCKYTDWQLRKPHFVFTASYPSPFWINTIAFRDQLGNVSPCETAHYLIDCNIICENISLFLQSEIADLIVFNILSCRNYELTFHFSPTLRLVFSSKLISISCISHLFTLSIPLPSSPPSASC